MNVHCPRVSVVLPVHNGMPFLPETIESLMRQSLDDFEVIVVDDNSEDESPAYLKSLTDRRFRYFRLVRGGIARALNFGIKQARGDLIARIDADDIAYPTRFERQLAAFENQSDLVLLGCSFDVIDSEGRITGDWNCLVTDLANRWLMLFTTPFAHPGVMYRRSAALAAGGYNPECPVAQDYELWVRLAERGRIGNLTEKLIQKRTHSQTWGKRHSDQQRRTASRAAAMYAQRLGIGIPGDIYRQLYAFLWWGETPTRASSADLVDAFHAARNHFVPLAGSDDTEFWMSVAYFERQFCCRCHEQAKQQWRRPQTMSQWLKRAHMVNRQYGGVWQIITRKIVRVIRRRPLHEPNPTRHAIG